MGKGTQLELAAGVYVLGWGRTLLPKVNGVAEAQARRQEGARLTSLARIVQAERGL